MTKLNEKAHAEKLAKLNRFCVDAGSKENEWTWKREEFEAELRELKEEKAKLEESSPDSPILPVIERQMIRVETSIRWLYALEDERRKYDVLKEVLWSAANVF